MGKKHLRNFSSLFGFLLLGLSLWAIGGQLREYNYHDILNSLVALPKIRLVWALGLTSLAYLALSGYDLLALHYIRYSLAYWKIVLANFISNAVSNTIGLSLLTSSAIHYRFYSGWGIPPVAIAIAIAFVNLSFCLGLLALGGVIFLLVPLPIPPQINFPWLSARPLGVIFLLIIGIYLLGSLFIRKPFKLGNLDFRFPSFKMAAALIAVSSVEWGLAAAVLYTLLPETTALSYPTFLGIYLLAMAAGVFSNVPGGLGVFETIVLLLVWPHIPAATVFASLLAYRGVYYFLPLFIATLLLGFYELKTRSKYKSKRW
ncbi:MAG TPA: hypothetical protein DDZ80_10375 [Cyanobacteria bacterium UBA8803]|nr:hypothetical protein [Cyanobacteria bacterium UBA9273]HBL58897.1 hypothetical protein [Cyanobacteria bacterium UBA8803]